MSQYAVAKISSMNESQLSAPEIATGATYGEYKLVNMYGKDINDFLAAGEDGGITNINDVQFMTYKEAQVFAEQHKKEDS